MNVNLPIAIQNASILENSRYVFSFVLALSQASSKKGSNVGLPSLSRSQWYAGITIEIVGYLTEENIFVATSKS